MAPRIETFISVDIEASGPIPSAYSMLALGACVVGDPSRSFYAELQPVSDHAVEEAMHVIGRPLVAFGETGRDPAAVMRDFREWIGRAAGTSVPVFVGFNATFDWAFVNWYFHTYLGENPFGVAGADIKSYYMGLTGVSWRETKSSRIRREFKGSEPHRHNALADALEQAAMFDRMLHAEHRPIASERRKGDRQ
jgi:DNA polymerase III epsilon subunit-like protein